MLVVFAWLQPSFHKNGALLRPQDALEIVLLRLPCPALIVAFAMVLPPPVSCSGPALQRIEHYGSKAPPLARSAEVYVPRGYDPQSRLTAAMST